MQNLERPISTTYLQQKTTTSQFLLTRCLFSTLLLPEMKEVSNFDGTKYTASWGTVPSAERYNYIAYYDRKATQTGEFVVTQEDFTDVRDSEGNLTGWTKENPSNNSYGEFYIPELKQGGWKGTN